MAPTADVEEGAPRVRAQDLPATAWAELADHVGGRLVAVDSPLEACQRAPGSDEARAALRLAENPYAIEDHPGGFHTTGWHGAFTSRPSPYAVAAASTDDIAATVRFARRHHLNVVIKGTGHDYLGRSARADALTIWTHPMRRISLDGAFQATGGRGPGTPAITFGAGTRWLEAYQAAIAGGRYVQGGGCTSVGAAGGFTQGGGFGSHTKRYGTAAGNVLEMTVVTADGEVVVANEHQHPDLFWALRGGGGGTFGVVAEMTMRTHPLPEAAGAVSGLVRAHGDQAYRDLVRQLVDLYPALDNPSWGELVSLGEDNVLSFSMLGLELTQAEMDAVWRPFLNWVDRHPGRYTNQVLVAAGLPFARTWDPQWWDTVSPDLIRHDDRPGQPPERYWWDFNQGEVSWFLNTYQSRWLPRRLFIESPGALAEALFAASRGGWFTLQVNKGLSGTSPEARRRDEQTAVHPAAFQAAALLIMVSCQQRRFPGLTGLAPDPTAASIGARRVTEALRGIRELAAGAGTYLNETDYFEESWQESFWGPHYQRLLAVKARYDPTNLFRVHHGVGSES